MTKGVWVCMCTTDFGPSEYALAHHVCLLPTHGTCVCVRPGKTNGAAVVQLRRRYSELSHRAIKTRMVVLMFTVLRVRFFSMVCNVSGTSFACTMTEPFAIMIMVVGSFSRHNPPICRPVQNQVCSYTRMQNRK